MKINKANSVIALSYVMLFLLFPATLDAAQPCDTAIYNFDNKIAIDLQGNPIFRHSYDGLVPVYKGDEIVAYWVSKGRNLGLIDTEGKEIVPPEYTALTVRWPLVIYGQKPRRKFGKMELAVLNAATGKVILPSQTVDGGKAAYYYPQYGYFSMGDGNPVLDLDGNSVSEPYESVGMLSKDIWVVQKSEQKNSQSFYAVVNSRGEILLDFNYDKIRNYSPVAILRRADTGLWGAVDHHGQVIVPFDYDTLVATEDGPLDVQKILDGSRKKDLVAEYAEKIGTDSEYEAFLRMANSFSDRDPRSWNTPGYLMGIKDGRVVLLKDNGDPVLTSRYPAVYPNGLDLDPVNPLLPYMSEQFKWGFIDLQQNIVLPAKYDFALGFVGDTGFVIQDGVYMMIDRNGDLVHRLGPDAGSFPYGWHPQVLKSILTATADAAITFGVPPASGNNEGKNWRYGLYQFGYGVIIPAEYHALNLFPLLTDPRDLSGVKRSSRYFFIGRDKTEQSPRALFEIVAGELKQLTPYIYEKPWELYPTPSTLTAYHCGRIFEYGKLNGKHALTAIKDLQGNVLVQQEKLCKKPVVLGANGDIIWPQNPDTSCRTESGNNKAVLE